MVGPELRRVWDTVSELLERQSWASEHHNEESSAQNPGAWGGKGLKQDSVYPRHLLGPSSGGGRAQSPGPRDWNSRHVLLCDMGNPTALSEPRSSHEWG